MLIRIRNTLLGDKLGFLLDLSPEPVTPYSSAPAFDARRLSKSGRIQVLRDQKTPTVAVEAGQWVLERPSGHRTVVDEEGFQAAYMEVESRPFPAATTEKGER